MLYNQKYQNVPYPSTSSLDVDFSKYYSDAEHEFEVTHQIQASEEKEPGLSKANFLNLIQNISSILIRYRDGKYILDPYIIWDGKRSFLPEDLEEDDVAFLSEILPKIQPNVLRAKVAESLWGKTKNRKYAIEAEYAYMELIQSDIPWHEQDEYWGRILYIDKNIKGGKESEIKSIAANKILKDELDVFAVLWFCTNLFKENDLSPELLETIFSRLKEFFSRIGVYDRDEIKPTLELIRRDNKEKADELNDILVNSFVKRAESLVNSNATYAAIHYDSAIKYVQFISDKIKYGVECRKDEYLRRCREIRQLSFKDMRRISKNVDISRDVEKVQEYFSAIEDKWKALFSFAAQTKFSEEEFVQLNEDVKKSIVQSSYTFLGGSYKTVDSYGRVIASDKGLQLEEPIELQDVFIHRRASYFRDMIDFRSAGVLQPALQCMIQKFEYPHEELYSVLQACANIPPDNIQAFVHGFYLMLKGDVFAAIHMLAPSFEAFIRSIFIKNQWKVTYLKDGKEQFLVLGSLIEDSLFVEKFGKEMQFQIYTVFCDPCGTNLRNDIAHGLYVPTEKTLSYALYAVAFILNFLIYEKSLEGRAEG